MVKIKNLFRLLILATAVFKSEFSTALATFTTQAEKLRQMIFGTRKTNHSVQCVEHQPTDTEIKEFFELLKTFKVFRFKLTGVNGDAPTLVTLQNDIGADPTPTRSAEGVMLLTFAAGLLTTAKTSIFLLSTKTTHNAIGEIVDTEVAKVTFQDTNLLSGQKIFRCTLTGVNGDAPTIVVQRNDIGADPTPVRSAEGINTLTFAAGLLVATKTSIRVTTQLLTHTAIGVITDTEVATISFCTITGNSDTADDMGVCDVEICVDNVDPADDMGECYGMVVVED